MNTPDPKPYNSKNRASGSPEPYYYDKPNIPFDYDKQPAPANTIETFEGYEYPKPKEPFPQPTTNLPGATNRK